MPDYAEQAEKDGWFKEGAKWKNDKHPGKVYYNAKQIWDEMLPERLKRPLSINDVGKKHEAPPPPSSAPKTDDAVKQQGLIGGAGKWEEAPYKPVSLEQQYEAQKPRPQKPKRVKGFKYDVDGYLVPKGD